MEFRKSGPQVRQVADAEAHQRSGEGAAGEGQPLRVAANRGHGGLTGLVKSLGEHGEREVGAHHPASKPILAGKLQSQIEGARAGVQIASRGGPLPSERRDRTTAPPPVDVEAEHMIEQVVAVRDLAEEGPHLRGPIRSVCGLRLA